MDPLNSTEATSSNEDAPLQNYSNEDGQQDNAGLPQTTDSLAFQAQSLTNKALQFLSEASNETLGACLVGLGATTYLVLGRVGLVLIGVVGGVALHAHWENRTEDGEDVEAREKEAKRRKEVGLDVAQRILDWQRRNSPVDTEDGLDSTATLGLKLIPGKVLDYSKFQPDTAAALNELTNAIVQDYVK